MLCYDSVFGKVFEADEQSVKLVIEQLNLELEINGYMYLGRYFDVLKTLDPNIGKWEPSSYIFNKVGFKNRDQCGFILTVGVLKEDPILIVQAPSF